MVFSCGRCGRGRYGLWPRPKTNLVHSRAVRKPLVAIIFNVLKCMFYTRPTIHAQQLAQINMMKSANKKFKNVWVSKQHLKFMLIVPPARGSGGITAGFGKILKFIDAKSSTAFISGADMLLCKCLISDIF